MVTQKNTHTAEKNAESVEKSSGNFHESAKNLRESAAKSALEIDARGNSPDILNGMEGVGVSEKNESGRQKKSDSNPSSSRSRTKAVTSGGKIGEISFPEPRIMARKIKTEITKEISEVEKTVKKLQKDPIHSAKELSDAVALLRKMRAFFLEIAYKTIEALRNLWIEISSGRKIVDIV